MNTQKIKLAIAEDHPLFLKGLVAAIREDIDDIDVIITAANGKELIEKIRCRKPDVILMDLRMPEMDGVEATAYIKKEHPDIKIIVLSIYDGEFTIAQLMKMGINAYLRKHAEIEEIQTAIYTVMQEGYYYDQYVARVMQKGLSDELEIGFDYVTCFKKGELETLKLICDGYTTAEIAEKLGYSSRTIESYRINLLDKFGVKNTTSLMRSAIKNNLVDVRYRFKNKKDLTD